MPDSRSTSRSVRRVTWSLGVSPEVLTEYAGTSLRAYYTDARTMLCTQLESARRFRELYGVEVVSPHVATPAYVGVAALGGEVIFPEDDSPMVANQGRVLPTDASVARLRVPTPDDSPLLQRQLDMRHFFEAETGRRPCIGAGQEGPITSAVLLRGERFLMDLLEAPHLTHHLLDVVTETYIAFVRYVRAINSDAASGVGLADDFAGLIAPSMWPEFVVPYWQRLFEALGPGRRVVHSELLRRGHLRYLAELGVDHFDPGVDQYLTAGEIAEEIAIPFTEYIWPVRDLLLGTPESIRRQYSEYVEVGVAHVDADVSCRGIPQENIRAFIAVAREYESMRPG